MKKKPAAKPVKALSASSALSAKARQMAPLRTPTDLKANATRDISAAMNGILADVFALYLKTKNFHWHMSGPHFRDYHVMLDEQSDQIYAMTDPIAERVRKVGGTTLRSIGHIARTQRILDNDADYVEPSDMIAELCEDNKTHDAAALSGLANRQRGNMLELQVLYRKLEAHNASLEQTVLERTAALHDSEARFQHMAALASDWYWEQGAGADGTTVSGPVAEILGLRVTAFFGHHSQSSTSGWNADEQQALQALIATRQPFSNFVFSRINGDGTRQQFSVSGEPMLDRGLRFVGYRGIGVETTGKR